MSSAGRGRPTLGTSPSESLSRQKFKCPVKGCEKDFRSDKLREHFQNQVLWNNEGNPVVKTLRMPLK